MRNGWAGAGRWYAVAVAVVLLDRLSKGAASAALEYGRPQPVFSWFNLTLQHNTGAAFSFLSDASGWQRWFFSAVAVIISALLAVWLYRLPRDHRLLALGLGLVLGGAVGNLWDRLALGYVVDFISVHWENRYFFPAFNLADSAITVGAGCLLLDGIVNREAAESRDREAQHD